MNKKKLMLQSTIALSGALSIIGLNTAITTFAEDTIVTDNKPTEIVEPKESTCPAVPDNQVESEIEETKVEVVEDEKIVEEAKEAQVEAEKEVNSAKEELDSSNKEYEEAVTENNNLKEEKENTDPKEINNQLDENQSKIDTNLETIKSYEKEEEETINKIEAHEFAIENVTKNLEEATTELNNIQKDIDLTETELAKISPESIQEKIDLSNKKIEDLNNIITESQEAVDNLKNSEIPENIENITAKESQIADATAALEMAKNKLQIATDTLNSLNNKLDTKDSELKTLEDERHYMNTIRMPEGVTIEKIVEAFYTGDKKVIDALLQSGIENVYISNPKDKEVIIDDFANLSDELRIELNKFSLSIINGLRQSLGINNDFKSNLHTLIVADEVANKYEGLPFNHYDVWSEVENSTKVVIYLENLGGVFSANNLDQLKAQAYNTIKMMIFEDADQNYGHLINFISYQNPEFDVFLGVSTYNTSEGFGGMNFNFISHGWDSTLDESLPIDIPSNDTKFLDQQILDMKNEITNLKDKITTAQTDVNTKDTKVNTISNLITTYNTELSNLKNKLSEVQNSLNEETVKLNDSENQLTLEISNNESLKSDLTKIEEVKGRVQNILNNLKDQKSKKLEVIDYINRELTAQKTIVDDLNKDLGHIKENINSVESEQAVLAAEKIELMDKLARYKNIDKLIEESHRLVDKLEKLKAEDEEKYNEALKKNEAALKYLEDSISQYLDAKKRLECLEEKLAVMKEEENNNKPTINETTKPYAPKKEGVIVVDNKGEKVVKSSMILPSTGSDTNYAVFGFGALTTISGLGLLVFKKKDN